MVLLELSPPAPSYAGHLSSTNTANNNSGSRLQRGRVSPAAIASDFPPASSQLTASASRGVHAVAAPASASEFVSGGISRPRFFKAGSSEGRDASPAATATARPRAVLYEPPQFDLREQDHQQQQQQQQAGRTVAPDGTAIARRMGVIKERQFGSGHGVLYDTPQRGSPAPLGAVARDGGVNFAVQSSAATSVSVCLFTPEDLANGRASAEVPLHPILNRTGNVWHVFLPTLSPGLLYGYRVGGPMAPQQGLWFDDARIAVDPYAKAVVSRDQWGQLGPDGECWPQMAGMVPHEDDDEYDWEGDTRPGYAMRDLVIYEAHVRGFTRHPSSNTTDTEPGTYAALMQKLPYLKAMGYNAIELMPVNEFNELEYYAFNPVTSQYKFNFWGYSTINFFSPMTRFAAAGGSQCGRAAVREFKDMVKACHRNGIEVILDVVFNHTAEGNEMGPALSFRALDNRVFYMTAPMGEFYNYSGCGNTFNCNHPVVRKFIVDCLRYWVTEMHVDGFRFDLASILTRASSMWDKSNVVGSEAAAAAAAAAVAAGGVADGVTTGTPLAEPPLIDMISNDPVLRSVKLIAEAWDAGGLYQVGSFPHWGIWAEWNGQYRDAVRQFIKGTDGMVGAFAQMLCGSPHLYQEGGRRPYHSVNFVTAHDGFTLHDLVSFNEKHNEANGEKNNDGENHNLSWNCGEEGWIVSRPVLQLRQRQMRNFIVALMVSQGVPMLFMGDEYGHTKKGNNNTYCHDNELNWMDWDKVRSDDNGLVRFCKSLIHMRRQHECFRLPDFPTGEQLQWHGHQPFQPDWSESSRFIAFTMKDATAGEVFVAFNAAHTAAVVTLPQRDDGGSWHPLVDTAKPPPYDFLSPDLPGYDTAVAQYAALLSGGLYPMLGYSAIVLTRNLPHSK